MSSIAPSNNPGDLTGRQLSPPKRVRDIKVSLKKEKAKNKTKTKTMIHMKKSWLFRCSCQRQCLWPTCSPSKPLSSKNGLGHDSQADKPLTPPTSIVKYCILPLPFTMEYIIVTTKWPNILLYYCICTSTKLFKWVCIINTKNGTVFSARFKIHYCVSHIKKYHFWVFF